MLYYICADIALLGIALPGGGVNLAVDFLLYESHSLAATRPRMEDGRQAGGPDRGTSDHTIEPLS
jgi:hypothetical protein